MLKIIISKAERSVFWYDVFTVNWLYLTWYGFPLLCCVAIVAVNSILFWKGIWDEDWPLHLYQGNGKQAFFLLILLFTEYIPVVNFLWTQQKFFEPRLLGCCNWVQSMWKNDSSMAILKNICKSVGWN